MDIIVGTHRLLQDDVRLKNLGLVIIDEEQRFGVTHKETLKKMRTEMDVLVLQNQVLYKHEQPPYEEAVDWRQQYELD